MIVVRFKGIFEEQINYIKAYDNQSKELEELKNSEYIFLPAISWICLDFPVIFLDVKTIEYARLE